MNKNIGKALGQAVLGLCVYNTIGRVAKVGVPEDAGRLVKISTSIGAWAIAMVVSDMIVESVDKQFTESQEAWNEFKKANEGL